MLFSYFRAPVGWAAILTRTAREMLRDNCFGLAAQLAFYFLLALFPAILFLVALIGILPVEDALSGLLGALGTVAPGALVTMLSGQLEEITSGESGGLLTLGIVGAVWSSSAAMSAIIDALNQAYDVTERRPWWRRRLLAVGLTLALALFILVALTFVLVGPSLAADVASWFGLAPAVGRVWQIVRWPTILFCAIFALDLVYHFAPSRRARWAWITPGALAATLLWVASSFGFKFYITNVSNYAVTYGALGSAIVTMLWFYVSGLAMLAGAEMNAAIEDNWRRTRADSSETSPPGDGRAARPNTMLRDSVTPAPHRRARTHS